MSSHQKAQNKQNLLANSYAKEFGCQSSSRLLEDIREDPGSSFSKAHRQRNPADLSISEDLDPHVKSPNRVEQTFYNTVVEVCKELVRSESTQNNLIFEALTKYHIEISFKGNSCLPIPRNHIGQMLVNNGAFLLAFLKCQTQLQVKEQELVELTQLKPLEDRCFYYSEKKNLVDKLFNHQPSYSLRSGAKGKKPKAPSSVEKERSTQETKEIVKRTSNRKIKQQQNSDRQGSAAPKSRQKPKLQSQEKESAARVLRKDHTMKSLYKQGDKSWTAEDDLLLVKCCLKYKSSVEGIKHMASQTGKAIEVCTARKQYLVKYIVDSKLCEAKKSQLQILQALSSWLQKQSPADVFKTWTDEQEKQLLREYLINKKNLREIVVQGKSNKQACAKLQIMRQKLKQRGVAPDQVDKCLLQRLKNLEQDEEYYDPPKSAA